MTEAKFKMDDGRTPRCLSMSLSHGLQCSQPVEHNMTGDPVHRNGQITWKTGGGPFDMGAWLRDVPLTSNSAPHGATELAQWWRDRAEGEIEQTVEKAVEYGSTDLIDIGRSIARIAGRNTGDFTDSDAALWGVFFYLEGKLSRWRSALERGSRPSFDTLLDIGVYARMAQRIVETGGWPGVEPPKLASTTSGTVVSDGPRGILNLAANDPVFHGYCNPDDPRGPDCTATKTYPRRSAG